MVFKSLPAGLILALVLLIPFVGNNAYADQSPACTLSTTSLEDNAPAAVGECCVCHATSTFTTAVIATNHKPWNFAGDESNSALANTCAVKKKTEETAKRKATNQINAQQREVAAVADPGTVEAPLLCFSQAFVAADSGNPSHLTPAPQEYPLLNFRTDGSHGSGAPTSLQAVIKIPNLLVSMTPIGGGSAFG